MTVKYTLHRRWYNRLTLLICWIWGHRRNTGSHWDDKGEYQEYAWTDDKDNPRYEWVVYDYCRRCKAIHPPFGEGSLRSWMVGTRLLMLKARFRMWRKGRKEQ